MPHGQRALKRQVQFDCEDEYVQMNGSQGFVSPAPTSPTQRKVVNEKGEIRARRSFQQRTRVTSGSKEMPEEVEKHVSSATLSPTSNQSNPSSRVPQNGGHLSGNRRRWSSNVSEKSNALIDSGRFSQVAGSFESQDQRGSFLSASCIEEQPLGETKCDDAFRAANIQENSEVVYV